MRVCGGYKVLMPLSGIYVSVGTLVRSYDGTNVAPIHKSKSLLS
jgi:hypothetical protein